MGGDRPGARLKRRDRTRGSPRENSRMTITVIARRLPGAFGFVLLALGPTLASGLDRIDYFVADAFERKRTPLAAVAHLDAVIFFKPVRPAANGSIPFDARAAAQLDALRQAVNPRTKIILGVGSLTPLVSDAAALDTALDRLEQLRIRHRFHGIDIDWEDMPESRVPVPQYAAVVRAIAERWRAKGCVVSTSHGQGDRYLPYAVAVRDSVDYVNLQFYFSATNALPLPDFKKQLAAYTAAGIEPGRIRIGLPTYGMVDVQATQTADKWRSWAALVAAGADVNDGTRWTDPKNGETYHYSGRSLLAAKIDHARAGGFAGIFTWELTQDVPYANEASVNRFIDRRTLGKPKPAPAPQTR